MGLNYIAILQFHYLLSLLFIAANVCSVKLENLSGLCTHRSESFEDLPEPDKKRKFIQISFQLKVWPRIMRNISLNAYAVNVIP